MEEYGDRVDALMHDVANNPNIQDGSFFPLARHMSWFDGHSFASGLFAFGNGKSQESSSEAVNCYFGAYMWSLVSHGATEEPLKDVTAKTDFARLLLATEIRGAKTYWQMTPKQSTQMAVYSPEFAKNYMVGNLGMLDVVCTTWFGTQQLYVHMINLIPITEAAAALFDKEYVRAEYNNVLSSMHEIDEAWRGFVVADHAIIDPNGAWEEAQQLFSPTLDAGLSKTQLLFFVATRANFDASEISEDTSSSAAALPGTPASSCRNHPACVDANLIGVCCPTPAGSFLGCCGADSKAAGTTTTTTSGDDQIPATNSEIVPADSSASTESSASCSSNPFCADANLVGNCCPTLEGVFLGCCAAATTSSNIRAAEPTRGKEAVATTENTAPDQKGSSASCSNHPACVDANLVGKCCPTPEGYFLGCCSARSSSHTTISTKVTENEKKSAAARNSGGNDKNVPSKQQQQQGASSSSCSTNPACAELGLVGECCPTPEGASLGCCA